MSTPQQPLFYSTTNRVPPFILFGHGLRRPITEFFRPSFSSSFRLTVHVESEPNACTERRKDEPTVESASETKASLVKEAFESPHITPSDSLELNQEALQKRPNIDNILVDPISARADYHPLAVIPIDSPLKTQTSWQPYRCTRPTTIPEPNRAITPTPSPSLSHCHEMNSELESIDSVSPLPRRTSIQALCEHLTEEDIRFTTKRSDLLVPSLSLTSTVLITLSVNGIATSSTGLNLILTELHRIFGRRFIGVHNRTFGIWFDIIECVLQRDLLWPTTDVRQGYDVISAEIKKPNKKRVVLMSHSQGGIIMSTWVDQMLADFSEDQLGKVEIYTFASAANHFSVPTTLHEKGPFARVEHFVNTGDYVSRIGLLAFAPPAPPSAVPGADLVPEAEGRYAGRIFQRLGATGHLFLTHYLPPGNSILDDPAVVKHSWLTKYKQGQGSIAA